jgi:Zn-finger nucleic acid-binding protein
VGRGFDPRASPYSSSSRAVAAREPLRYSGVMRRQATAESRARAERIAQALAGLLNDAPAVEDAPRAATGARLVCPRCAGEMPTVGAGHGVEIDQCLECGAIWLDAGELELLVADQAPGPDAPVPTLGEVRERMREVLPPTDGPVKYRDCPRCQQVMRRTNFGTISGVVVDECVRHGVLLDPGELQAIEVFVAMNGRVLGEAVRLEQGQRELPPPPPRSSDAGATGFIAETAATSLWGVLFP